MQQPTVILPDLFAEQEEGQDEDLFLSFVAVVGDESICEHCEQKIPSGDVRLVLVTVASEPTYALCVSHVQSFLELGAHAYAEQEAR